MKTLTLCLFLALAASLGAQQAALEEGRGRFRALDIYLDSKGTPLAAFQLEVSITNRAARIVGVEGGEHAAFREPPFYDPQAIRNERVILAAFSTNSPALLPTGRTRVATVHLQWFGPDPPRYDLKLEAAADGDNKRIFAQANLEERKLNEK